MANKISPKLITAPSSGRYVTTPAVAVFKTFLSVCCKVPLYSSLFSKSPFCIATVVSSKVLLLVDDSVF